MTDRFDEAITRFDEANAEDPNRESADGVELPKELLYARRMTAWLTRLEPGASEIVRLAVRAQHLRRWTIPRERYPMDRQGYRRWRSDLAAFHAQAAGAILREVGYDEQTTDRVQALLRKEHLATDPEAQLVEDVACLVFLEHYFAEFASRHEEAKLIDIVRKTWRKMSSRGQAAAARLQLPANIENVVRRAIRADRR